MKTHFEIGVDGSGIDELIKGIEEYKRWLEQKTDEFAKRLAELGRKYAEESFLSAEYDGINDVMVEVEEKAQGEYVVRANGEAVLFIEFGTGVNYPDNHPEKPDGVVGRGQYGYGLGKLNSWRYPEEGSSPGTHGVPDERHPGYIITRGNPASMSMYNAVRKLEEDFRQILDDVFRA